MSTHEFDEWVNECYPPDYQTTSLYTPPTVITPTEDDIKAMRAIVTEAVTLFAGKRGDVQGVSCFSDKDRDWQLALSDAVVLRDHPSLKGCSESEAIYFLRMTETTSNDPMVFMAGVVGTPTPSGFFPYTFKFWSAIPPGWKGSDTSNARCNDDDVEPLAQLFMACVDESMMNELPSLKS